MKIKQFFHEANGKEPPQYFNSANRRREDRNSVFDVSVGDLILLFLVVVAIFGSQQLS